MKIYVSSCITPGRLSTSLPLSWRSPPVFTLSRCVTACSCMDIAETRLCGVRQGECPHCQLIGLVPLGASGVSLLEALLPKPINFTAQSLLPGIHTAYVSPPLQNMNPHLFSEPFIGRLLAFISICSHPDSLQACAILPLSFTVQFMSKRDAACPSPPYPNSMIRNDALHLAMVRVTEQMNKATNEGIPWWPRG